MKKDLMLGALILFCISCKKENAVLQSGNIPSDKSAENNSSYSTISFSGYTWLVKNSVSTKLGPGPNFWSRNNVWVDGNGWLHLKLAKNATGKKWLCAEVQCTQSFGYGTYQWQVEGAIDKLDKNVVLGLFNYSGNDGFDEMDIEFARWGNNAWPNLNYTVWPAQTGFSNFSYTQNFSLTGTYTTQRFTRSSSSVVFKSMGGFYNDDTNLYATATCSGPSYSISTLSMPVYMNLWLFKGRAPSDGQDEEIVIHNFTYTPL